MATFSAPRGWWLVTIALCLVLLPGKAAAFGAGNIPSIAQVEGHNWRHGDIEDMLTTVSFLYGKKWTSMLIKRTYFGNWLRDYSQAVDVGSLKGVNAATIRILVWVLSFMAHGYATEEFEVTDERLGCYRPEEHIDNPLGYAENDDARKYDSRLRGPVSPVETEVDSRTGMKNYIANESGDYATSAGYLRYSFARSIHYGRMYTSGSNGKGKEEDLCEALRCLGQALHCMEDFSAHSNYCELALRELGFRNVFAHCGRDAEIRIKGKHVFPLVTGTFGAVDFLHSVLGEANDHFTQSEVDEVDIALKNAEGSRSGGGGGGGGGSSSRGFLGFGSSNSSSGAGDFISLVSKLPGVGGDFASQARSLQEASEAQERDNNQRSRGMTSTRDNQNQIPGMSADFDPVKTAGRIYPILQFRDKIVKAISRGIAKVPGLEKLLEHISETLTAFILGLLAPFIRPIIQQVSKVLKDGSSGVITASARSQLEPWTDPKCTDPTHSMLSKDHFTNVLNSCAGRVAATILQYTVPRILYAWENPGVPVDEVVNDVLRAFHHPALRSDSVEIQRDMFKTVKSWVDEHPRRNQLDKVLSSESVKNHKNHILNQQIPGSNSRSVDGDSSWSCTGGHGKPTGSLWSQVKTRDMDAMAGRDGDPSHNYMSNAPAPKSATPPSAIGEAASYYSGASDDRPSSGYNAPPPQPGPYVSGYPQQGPPGGYTGPPPPGQYGGGPPPGQYGGPPPGQYGGPPPGQYGGPPPQQYGGQYGGPPPGQYGGGPPPGQYGGPPPGQYGGPPPGQYGGPPPQGGYPGQHHGPPSGGYPGSGHRW